MTNERRKPRLVRRDNVLAAGLFALGYSANRLQRKRGKILDKRRGQSTEKLTGCNYGLEFNPSRFGRASPPRQNPSRKKVSLRSWDSTQRY